MKKKYIISIVLLSTVLSVVASLTLSTFFQSSEAQAQSCIEVPPALSWTLTSPIMVSNDNDTYNSHDLGVHKLCVLNFVEIDHVDDDLGACYLHRSGVGGYTISAREDNDNDAVARCQATCYD